MSLPSPRTPADEPFDASVFEDRAPSVGHLLRQRIADTPDTVAYSFPSGIAWDELSWSQLGDRVWVIKPVHIAGGYGQLTYHFNYIGPTGNNRDEVTRVRRRSQEVQY